MPDAGLAPYHREFWDWVWGVEEHGTGPDGHSCFCAIWFRGAAKSTHAETACIALGTHSGRRYGWYICSRQAQADDHVTTISQRLTSPEVIRHYPQLSEAKVQHIGDRARQLGWRRNRLWTEHGLVIDALGLDSAVRGAKLGDDRPSFMCHEKGTSIYTDAQWMLVEQHSTARERVSNGINLQVHGLPFVECVTPEHRYWARRVRSIQPFSNNSRQKRRAEYGKPGWVRARDLTVSHWIGLPIEPAIHWEADTVTAYESGHITQRGNDGRILSSKGQWTHQELREFSDPEWWWFFGLWWGDGHVSGKYQVGVTIADKDVAIAERVTNLLERAAIKFSRIPGQGCFQVIFSHVRLNRWLRTWKLSKRAAQKQPPIWVEALPFNFQQGLLLGYVDADGHRDTKDGSVRITSVSLGGLLAARRIFARLGVAATIRAGMKAREGVPFGRYICRTQQKYDLRVSKNAEWLGARPPTDPRYSFGRTFIADGHLWSKVRYIEAVGERIFIPITTQSRDYITAFGRSHNCFDDLDEELDAEGTIDRKIAALTRKIIPAGAPDCVYIVAQNLVHPNGIVTRLVDGRATYLGSRTVSGPHPAIEGLEYEGTGTDAVITAGTPTWPVFGLDVCQQKIRDAGIDAFLAECQHQISLFGEPRFDRDALAIHEGQCRPALPRKGLPEWAQDGFTAVWQLPIGGVSYVAYFDGAEGVGSDYCVTVIMRADTKQMVAMVRDNKREQREHARIAVRLIKEYNAFVGWERSHEADFAAVMEAEGITRVYTHPEPLTLAQQINGTEPRRHRGYPARQRERRVLVARVANYIEGQEGVIPSVVVVSECKTFVKTERQPDGEASSGNKDDAVFGFGGALLMCEQPGAQGSRVKMSSGSYSYVRPR